jgi:hypothetical protein
MAKKYWTYKGKKIPVKKYRLQTEKTNDQLYRELVRKVGQANKRLREIKREFGTLGWAGSKLKEKTEFNLVNTWRSSKGIKVSKNLSEQQMLATLNEINKFLKSKTSTVKGIKQTMKKQQETLRNTFKQFDIDITPEESQNLYKMFDDKDFSILYQYIDPSELYVIVLDAKDNGDTEAQFIKRIESYGVDGQDLELRQAILNLYYRWVV